MLRLSGWVACGMVVEQAGAGVGQVVPAEHIGCICLVCCRAMQADFGGGPLKLAGRSYSVAVASPLDACSPLKPIAAGTIAIMQRGAACLPGSCGCCCRCYPTAASLSQLLPSTLLSAAPAAGTCFFSDKALAAQRAGAAAALIFNNEAVSNPCAGTAAAPYCATQPYLVPASNNVTGGWHCCVAGHAGCAAGTGLMQARPCCCRVPSFLLCSHLHRL